MWILAYIYFVVNVHGQKTLCTTAMRFALRLRDLLYYLSVFDLLTILEFIS